MVARFVCLFEHNYNKISLTKKMVLLDVWRKIRNSGNKNPEILSTTHNCLKKILVIAQIVGVFPLNNLNDNPEKLEFTFKSWKLFYAGLVCSGYLFCASFSFYKAFKVGILLNQLSKYVESVSK